MSDDGNTSEELLRSGRACRKSQFVDGEPMDPACCSHSHRLPDACVCGDRPIQREPPTIQRGRMNRGTFTSEQLISWAWQSLQLPRQNFSCITTVLEQQVGQAAPARQAGTKPRACARFCPEKPQLKESDLQYPRDEGRTETQFGHSKQVNWPEYSCAWRQMCCMKKSHQVLSLTSLVS